MNKKTLVIGASENPSRYAYLAIEKLTSNNIPVEAIANKKGEAFGVKFHTDKIKFTEIDTITLYVGPKNQVEYYDYIVSLKPKRVLFNPGTENLELEKLLTKNDISFERACTLVLLSLNNY